MAAPPKKGIFWRFRSKSKATIEVPDDLDLYSQVTPAGDGYGTLPPPARGASANDLPRSKSMTRAAKHASEAAKSMTRAQSFNPELGGGPGQGQQTGKRFKKGTSPRDSTAHSPRLNDDGEEVSPDGTTAEDVLFAFANPGQSFHNPLFDDDTSSPVPQRKFPVEKAGASASEGIAAAVASSPAASSSSLGGRFDRDPAYAEFRTELFQLLSRLPDFCFDPSSVALPS